MYIPKCRNFSSEKARKKYIIKTECIADEFTVSLSKLYHDMDSSNKILALGEKYTAKTLPIYYFIYKKRSGQSMMTTQDNKSVSI